MVGPLGHRSGKGWEAYINLIFVVVAAFVGPWVTRERKDLYQFDMRCGCSLVLYINLIFVVCAVCLGRRSHGREWRERIST